jgi:hypothetical protein
MGHEAVIYGVIIGAVLHGAEDYRTLQSFNEHTLRSLPQDDYHPWVDATIFSLPGPYPRGTYRRQPIHFGITIKEDTSPVYVKGEYREWEDLWMEKFEEVLRKLFWTSARLVLESDFQPRRREFTWQPTEEALRRMYEEPHLPIHQWERSMRLLEGDKLYGT